MNNAPFFRGFVAIPSQPRLYFWLFSGFDVIYPRKARRSARCDLGKQVEDC